MTSWTLPVAFRKKACNKPMNSETQTSETNRRSRLASETVNSRLLTDLEAARYLGITTELLFSYTSWKCKAKPRKLRTKQLNGQTYFDLAELDAFDRYLWEPWATEGSTRLKVPTCIVKHLIAESGNQCARCGKGISVQNAHINAWARSQCNHHHNLVRICSQCHSEHDIHKSLSHEDLLALKDELVAATRMQLVQHMQSIEEKFLPPYAATTFMGRMEELQTIGKALQGTRTVLIRGPGGIGKTQLLLRAMAHIKVERRVFWIEVERFSGVEDLLAALRVMLTEGTSGETLSSLANRLDALMACVVLDGVEHFTGPDYDQVDDLLADLRNRTTNTQFVVTSQVDLHRTPFDEKHTIAGLRAESSRRLLRSLVQDKPSLDEASEAALLEFAEGHPLALRLIAALVTHLGSGRTAMEQIDRLGARFVEIPKRAKQARQTSLGRSLCLAYEMLNGVEQRILYVVASCPGGIFEHILKRYGGSETPLLVAALRHWSLAETIPTSAAIDRWYVLSPIRSYVLQRWGEEHVSEARALRKELLTGFGVMAAVMDQHYKEPSSIPHMLARFSEELPNLLLVVNEAEARPGYADLDILARGICAALMRFFFVSRLPKQGVRLMKRGARIAMRNGDWKGVSANIAQAVALSQRSNDPRIAEGLEPLLAEIPSIDAEISGNVAITRAMFARQRNDACATEKHARVAITKFQEIRKKFVLSLDDQKEDSRWEENSNDLAGAYQLLGDALLHQNSAEDARTAYEKAQQLTCGASGTVNEGQILHQIGNCHSILGKHADAARNYVRAAACFQAIGMEDYLSNALGELGYAVLQLDDNTELPESLATNVLVEGLDDVMRSVLRCFSVQPNRDDSVRASAVRKLFGVVVVLSLSNEARRLGVVGGHLKSWVLKARGNGDGEDEVTSPDKLGLLHLEALAALMLAIAEFEHRLDAVGRVSERDIDNLSEVCGAQGPWVQLSVSCFDWMNVYLRRKWSFAA